MTATTSSHNTDKMSRMDTDAEVRVHELSGSHWPLLGTVLDLRIGARNRSDAERAEEIVCDEIGRLEGIFSLYDASSLLNRWIIDPTTETSIEFGELLALSLRWQRCSRGAFNVSTRRLRSIWAQAATDDCRPSAGELRELTQEMICAPYDYDGSVLRQVGDCTGIDVNAIAKGFIVDRAVDLAWGLCSLESLTVSAGGDVAHRGLVPVRVGIEDPLTPLDNAPALLTVEVCNAAVATSGSARRGVTVGDQWISHLLDPRTGQPAGGSGSVTVVAPDAATADVVATIVSVMEPAEGIAFVDMLDSNRAAGHPAESFGEIGTGRFACWVIDRHGAIRSSAAAQGHEVGTSADAAGRTDGRRARRVQVPFGSKMS